MVGEDDLSVDGGWQAAQALHFIGTLREQLLKMTSQLSRLERQDVTARNARAYAMRLEAAALRQDIRQAQVLIDRLRTRYRISDEPTQR